MSEATQDDRLLNLEGAVRELGRVSERVAVGQEHMLETMTTGFDSLAKGQKALDDRLKPLEAVHVSQQRRSEIVKKLALPAVAATAGVFGAKFGQQLISWLGGLFGH